MLDYISDRIRMAILRRALPIPAEILLLGCCTRGWILDHGTMVRRQKDIPATIPDDLTDIGNMASQWCSARNHSGRRIRWKDFTIDELAHGIEEPVQKVRIWFQMVAEIDFRRWKTQQRIGLAKELLEEGGKDIASVAHLAGFNDISNFSRQFRRITGCAPSAWKN